MPGFTSIINSLLRILPTEVVSGVSKAVSKLHPRSENLSDATVNRQAFEEFARQWHTRHAFEACRGWHWPFWMNAHRSPASTSHLNPANNFLLANLRARDAAIVPGLDRTFTGTFDPRGMLTPRGEKFSIETWFRLGKDETFFPADQVAPDGVSHEISESHVTVFFRHDGKRFSIRASAEQIDEFQFIRLQVRCINEPETAPCAISICFSIRPYHTRSVAPLQDLVYNSRGFWMSESRIIAWLPVRPDESWASDAAHDDAAFFLNNPPERTAVRCAAGMATAVSVLHFPAEADREPIAELIVPLEPIVSRSFPFMELGAYLKSKPLSKGSGIPGTMNDLAAVCRSQLSGATDYSHAGMREEFNRNNHWLLAAVKALLAAEEFEHAAGLLGFAGLSMQKNGYMAVSGGRWALHGMYLVALAEFYEMTKKPVDGSIASYPQIRSVARWIMRKRREVSHAPEKPRGLLPPGVTASGVGTEYNLVDNFWGLEGLAAASALARMHQEHADADNFRKESERYAARISAAVHRELEYGLSQLVPSRLQRAFDASSAAELLDLALMPTARRLLKADDWLSRVVDYLNSPLPYQTVHHSNIAFRRIDENGIRPANHMMLCLTMLVLNHRDYQKTYKRLENLRTNMGIWTEALDPATGMGCGDAAMDIEATAIYLLLARHVE